MAETREQRPAVERVKPPEAMINVANPIMYWLLRSPLHGLVDEHLMVLHFRGRKTHRPYTVVVGQRTIEGKLATLTNSPWRVNFRGGAPVDVTLKGERRAGHAELVEDPEGVARVYANLIDEYGYEKAGRHLGIRINVDRKPTHEELVDVIERSGLSFITIDLGEECRSFGYAGAGDKVVAPGVARLALGVVNAYLVGEVGGRWVLVDAGTPGNAERIHAAAQERFGAGARPEAIVLTHGHTDHSGSAAQLSDLWGVPVYAHRLELPFLTGLSAYPPPDPTVGGPLALLSRFMPREIIDLGEDRARELPSGGEVPGMPGWRWIPTPGHTPGHVCLFRPEDGVLLAGDALATVDADSFSGMLSRRQKISRPATPVTPDWDAAERSAREIAALRARVLAPGHGEPMEGPIVATQLNTFAENFAAPERGRYVGEPARFDERGVAWLPPAPPDPLPKVAAVLGAALLAAAWLAASRRRRQDWHQKSR
ncbi:MAG: MBL fold metallo-hydrolase [Actinomycetota bacterium]|nr:MBL fold metallo-hydrolase [Actinomycetota bacterium]